MILEILIALDILYLHQVVYFHICLGHVIDPAVNQLQKAQGYDENVDFCFTI